MQPQSADPEVHESSHVLTDEETKAQALLDTLWATYDEAAAVRSAAEEAVRDAVANLDRAARRIRWFESEYPGLSTDRHLDAAEIPESPVAVTGGGTARRRPGGYRQTAIALSTKPEHWWPLEEVVAHQRSAGEVDGHADANDSVYKALRRATDHGLIEKRDATSGQPVSWRWVPFA